MGIEDIQISEELQTNAPSIKYSGNEGPKSPQEMERVMIASLEEEYSKYVFEMQEQGLEPMSMQQFIEQAMAEGQMSGGQPLPQDPTKPVNPFAPKPTGPVLPDRQMAAYGGMMGGDGRRRYGLGSFLKKTVRKLIPNEIADIAVKAAPFVAPFNPIAAGLMAGIGGFDQTGKIGSSIKSGLMNYGMGQLSRGIGGGMDNLQKMSFKVPGGSASGFGQYFSSPVQSSGGLGEIFDARKTANIANAERAAMTDANIGFGSQDKNFLEKVVGKVGEYVPTSFSDLTDPKKILGALGIYKGVEAITKMGPEKAVSEIMKRGEKLDIDGIRAEVIEAFKDQSGEKLAALRTKYPYLGTQGSKNIAAMAMGGRIGKAEGGIMDLGGMEKDYRAEGGFVPIGKKEKADDVPARLSVNEFVFTADAVRNAGGGDIDKGAEIMENMMKNLEAGGQVSEESQGMAGAQQMFQTSERLSEVI